MQVLGKETEFSRGIAKILEMNRKKRWKSEAGAMVITCIKAVWQGRGRVLWSQMDFVKNPGPGSSNCVTLENSSF